MELAYLETQKEKAKMSLLETTCLSVERFVFLSVFTFPGRQSIIRSPEPQRKTRAASAGSSVTASPRNRLTPTGSSAADVCGATPRRPRRHSTADASITGTNANSKPDSKAATEANYKARI